MIYDCFTFFNEFDILDIRLHEMDKWVDYFILVESPETFSGKPKPLWFHKANKDRYRKFLPKIIHLVAPIVKGDDPWDRQDRQRSFAMQALSTCSDDDLILVSDVDEIVGIDFADIQRDFDDHTCFTHKNYLFYMNLLRPGGWPGLIVVPYRTLISKYKGSLWEARRLRRRGRKTVGGWHFSNMGGKDAVRLKLQASCHHELDSYKKMINDPAFLYNTMEGEREIKGRKLNTVPIDYEYPVWFKDNIDKFKHLLTKEVEPMPTIAEFQRSKALRIKSYIGRVKWAKDLLDKTKPKGKLTGVEVGLWKADFPYLLLPEMPRLRWFGVDPYSLYGRGKRRMTEWDAIFGRVMNKMKPFGKQFIMIRKHSHEGVKFIPKKVDFVFVDGNHDLDIVSKDLALYEPHVKKGGIMAGHDYFHRVSPAVDEYVKEHNRKLHVDTSFDPCGIFWWRM